MKWFISKTGMVTLILASLVILSMSFAEDNNIRISNKVLVMPGDAILINWDASPVDVNRALSIWLKTRNTTPQPRTK